MESSNRSLPTYAGRKNELLLGRRVEYRGGSVCGTRNSSASSTISDRLTLIPQLLTGGHHLKTAEFLIGGDTLEFGLITSDGLYEQPEWINVGPFFHPFQVSLWAGMALGILAVALSIAGLCCSGKQLKNFLHTIFPVLMVLVAQPRMPVLVKQKCMDGAEDFRKKMVCLWALWLFAAVLLTWCFSAAFSSNYIFEPEYTRNWTKGFLGMENFTVFIGVGEMEKPAENKYLTYSEQGYHIFSNDMFC